MNENNNIKEKQGFKLKPMSFVGIILCLLLLPILVINVTLIIKSYTHEGEIPNIGGVFPMIVMTDSMYPEIKSGDLIICHQINAEDVKVGDVICFFDPDGNGMSTVTHRVVSITETEKGELAFETKGDANNTTDRIPIPASKLVGVYQSRIAGLGKVALFMQTTVGLVVCVVLPLILLVAIDLLRTRRFEKSHKQDTEALMRELEELRARQAAATVTAASAAECTLSPPEEEKAPLSEVEEAESKQLKPDEIGNPEASETFDEVSSEEENSIGDGNDSGEGGGAGDGEGGGGDM